MSPSALRAETSSRNKISHVTDDSCLSQEKVMFFCRPSFSERVQQSIADITRVLAIRASCFYISSKNLGQAS